MTIECSVFGCCRPAHLRGWCLGHYKRWLKHGWELASTQPTHAELLWRHIKRQPDSCWLWTGFVGEKGYGQVGRWRTGHRPAHRAVYELLVGPVPQGLDLDHLCRNRACVNPSHLEPVTRSENLRRAPRMGHVPGFTCAKGHLFTPANTLIKRDGRRRCRICKQETDRRYYEART